MSKIYTVACSDGHGMETAGKRTPEYPDGTQIRENEFNHACKTFLIEELKRQPQLTPYDVSPERTDTPLYVRTNRANNKKCNIFWSGHFNALTNSWRSGEGGIETYHYPNSSSGKKLATSIHKYSLQGTPLKNRGVKSANFFVLRETTMPAVLSEFGFMDILKEANLMRDLNYQKECAIEVCKGICEYFNLTYVPETPSGKKNYEQILKEVSKWSHVYLEDLKTIHKEGHNWKGLIEVLYYTLPK